MEKAIQKGVGETEAWFSALWYATIASLSRFVQVLLYSGLVHMRRGVVSGWYEDCERVWRSD